MKVAKLTVAEREFAIKYAETNSPLRAYEHAYKGTIAQRKLSSAQITYAALAVYRRVHVQEFIKEIRTELSGSSLFDLQQMINELTMIAFADPAELSQVRIGCCRYCYGHNFKYQHIDAEEYTKDCLATISGNPPSLDGGVGFDARLPPVHGCTHCWGKGEAVAWIAPTNALSPAGRRLYAGAEVDKNGNIKVNMHNQMEAKKMLLQILGVYGKGNLAGRPGEKQVSGSDVTIHVINSPDE